MTNTRTQSRRRNREIRGSGDPAHAIFRVFRSLNPERIESLSPGLRMARYPGCATGACLNPEGVLSFVRGAIPAVAPYRAGGMTPGMDRTCGAATLTGLGCVSVRSPRVVRGSQPWAERSNPFGIAVEWPLGLPVSDLSSCRWAERSNPFGNAVQFPLWLRAADFLPCRPN
jgi:hypothetical protein